jgi:transcriptional regulator GlxA family with amidase domain
MSIASRGASRPHRIVIAGFPPAQILDVTGPLEVLYAASSVVEDEGGPKAYEILLASPGGRALVTTSGVTLAPMRKLEDPKLVADTLLLAGGQGARLAARDVRLMKVLAGLCRRTPRVGSICTGTFPLAATGLLDGRRATTHWAHFDEFAELFPQVEIDRDALFVGDDRVQSSAGITAGIDYALAIVERDLGRRIALRVARELVVFLKRPGGQSQFSAQLAAEIGAEDPEHFGTLTRWMAEHLGADLSVETLAERVAMSPRNFARRFIQTMKVSPGRYVQTLRVDAARRLLTDGQLPVVTIARRCGFPSAEAMRVAFQRNLNVAPSEFRARFQSVAAAPRA